MRWKGGKRWAFVTPALFPGPCPLNNPLELGLFPGQLLVGRNAGNCISQIETRWSSASITLSGSPHRSVWSVTFHHSLLLCSCPMSAFKTTNIFGKWLQPGKHMQTFFCWAVTHLEAHLGFLLSTVNTCCFIPCQKKKKKRAMSRWSLSQKKTGNLTIKSNDQKLERTVRAHQIHVFPGQIERSSKYPG